MFDSQYRREPQEDPNANNRRLCDGEHLQQRVQRDRSSLRREIQDSRQKDPAIRRRESKKDKVNTRCEGTSDAQDQANGRVFEHYPVVRRQSDSRIRNRDVKRRKSSCKESREVPVVVRRDSDRRNKEPRYDDGYPDYFDTRKEVAKVHRKDSFNGLWGKDAEHLFMRTDENWNGRQVNNHLSIDNNRYTDGYSRVGSAEKARSISKSLHEGNKHELPCSPEKINSNDFIRLKCGYASPVVNRGNTDVIRNGLVEREVNRIQVRNSGNIFPRESDEQCARRRRSEFAELCRRESQKEERRVKARTYEHSDQPEKDNRVKRKSSSTSKDRRAHSDLEGRSELNKVRRLRKQESLNEEIKRRQAIPNMDDSRHIRTSFTGSDINRNESVHLNTESTVNLNSRTDNSLYDKKDNGNFETEAEIFPFDSFVKPPPYNLVKYHITERSGHDQKDRIRQKKVAITDYL